MTFERSLGWFVVVAAVLVAAGCESADDVEVGAGAGDGDDAAVVVLAKAEGWRAGLQRAAGNPYVLVEVAADRESAERAWSDNVPEALPEAGGDPADPGVYHPLESVDFDRQRVAVFSSGESGSCPAWVSGLSTNDGRVAVELRSTAEAGGACTDDYRPYRLVLAVGRGALPPLADLPVERIDVPSENLTDVDGRVVAYPAGSPTTTGRDPSP